METGFMKNIMTIAGSDTCAGAGLQQDLKTITALGHYAVTVTTALTAQNTMGVQRVMAVTDDMLEAQLDSLMSDIGVSAVKIGMIPNVALARVVVSAVRRLGVAVVCDPVMVSTSGTQLMADECVDYIKSELFPLCTLVTPNIPEAVRLAGTDGCGNDLDAVGRQLVAECHTSVLIKGGHADGSVMRDVLYCADGSVRHYCKERIITSNLHGTGCTMSSAVATFLAEGLSLPEAVGRAKDVVAQGIEKGRTLNIGKGNGPLWMF